MAYTKQTTLRLTDIGYHRNGVGGRPFYAVAFRVLVDGGWRNMIATVFEADEMELGEVHPITGLATVMDADLAARGVVTMPENTWRADVYEPQLRQWIAQRQVEVVRTVALESGLKNPA